MSEQKRHLFYCLLAALDVLIVVGSYFLAARLYIGSLQTLAGLRDLTLPLMHGGGITALFIYAFLLACSYALSGVYGRVYHGHIRKMAKSVVLTNTVGIVLFAAALYLLHLDNVSRFTLLLFYLFSTILVVFKEWVTIQLFYRFRKNRHNWSPVLVVGSGKLAQRYAAEVGGRNSRAERVVGFVTPTQNTPTEATSNLAVLKEYLGTTSQLEEIVSRIWVEEIVIALEPSEYKEIQSISAVADKYGLRLTLVPFFTDAIPVNPTIDSVAGVKLLNMRSMPLSKVYNAVFKRTFDIVVSALILVCFSWLYILVTLGVKLSSPGPVFFKQERVGLNNKRFQMLKFRSMRVNAESTTAWSTDEDPRKTKFGSFIRKVSIDELPQFINVFKGDMSIVGPRPEIPYYVETFRETIPRYMLRHQVRPGVTGWAQINGYRGDTSITERINHDLWYIEHWTFWLDVKIFFRTLFGGFLNSEKLS